MNKAMFQILILGAVAEVIMFGSLILRGALTLGNIANGYLYIFVIMFFYLSVLRTFKSYKAAFSISVIAALVPAFNFIYNPLLKPHLAAALFCAASFFSYTFIYAKGLKHNQDKHFLLLSLLLYSFGVYFSPVFALLPFLLFAYEKNNADISRAILIRLLFFIPFACAAFVAGRLF